MSEQDFARLDAEAEAREQEQAREQKRRGRVRMLLWSWGQTMDLIDRKTTKTASGKRVIPLNGRAMEAVQHLREQEVPGCP